MRCYLSAMRAAGHPKTTKTLDQCLANPRRIWLAARTPCRGLKNAGKRADVINCFAALKRATKHVVFVNASGATCRPTALNPLRSTMSAA